MRCLRYLAWGAAIGAWVARASPLFAAPEAVLASGKVVTPDGRPAAGVSVVYDRIDFWTHTVTLSRTARTDQGGTFEITDGGQGGQGYAILHLTSPAGVAIVKPTVKTQTIVLQPFTSIRVHLRTADGKPIAHVSVAPNAFRSQSGIAYWDDLIAGTGSEETDENGVATFSRMPQGYSVRFNVNDDRYAFSGWDRYVRLASTPGPSDLGLNLTPGYSLSGTVRNGVTGQPVADVLVSVKGISGKATSTYGMLRTDAEGRYRIHGLDPADYILRLHLTQEQAAEWTAAARSITLSDREGNLAGIDFSLIHGALLTGRITDADTGRPHPGASVQVVGPAAPDASGETESVNCGPDGVYRIRVPAGEQTVFLYVPESRVSDGGIPRQRVTLADGATKSIDFRIPSQERPQPIRGIVIGPNGKPIADAEVVASTILGGMERRMATDAKGRFLFEEPGLLSGSRLYARYGAMATASPLPLAKQRSQGIVLRLASGDLCRIQGRVRDQEGKPVANAKVTLMREGADETDHPVSYTRTDARGLYSFPPTYADIRHHVQAEAPGYSSDSSEEVRSVAGRSLKIPPLVIARTDSFVAGTVVDSKGNPAIGAEVNASGLGDVGVSTDAEGRFRIEGAPRGITHLQVVADGDRSASVEAPSGHNDIRIVLQSRAESMEADTTNHGDGTNANALLKSAEARAGANGRRVFLVFHASWCGPCFLLHRYLNAPKIKPIIEAHFVVQDIDIWEHNQNGWENPGGTALYKTYGGTNSIPYFAVLDASGKKLGDSMLGGENRGFPAGQEQSGAFLRMLKAAVPALTSAEMATLKAGLLARPVIGE